MSSPRCCACGREPGQILEYVLYAQDEGVTPDKFVRNCEGTYSHEFNTFACTECYIAMGEPTRPEGWRAGDVIIRYDRKPEKIEDLALEDGHMGETLPVIEESDDLLDFQAPVCGELEDMA